MSIQGTDQPRDRQGRFGTVQSPEDPSVALDSTEVSAADRAQECRDIAEQLVARCTSDGNFTASHRLDDVEHDMRESFPNLGADEFDARFAEIGKHAEDVSVLERCYSEEGDVETYAVQARDAGLDLDDFPLEDREPGEPYVDHQEFHRAVLEHHEGLLRDSCTRLSEANSRARSN